MKQTGLKPGRRRRRRSSDHRALGTTHRELKKEAFLSADVEARLLTNISAACLAAEEHVDSYVNNISGEALERIRGAFREHCQFVYRTAYSVTGNRQDAGRCSPVHIPEIAPARISIRVFEEPESLSARAAVNLALNTVRSRKHKTSPAMSNRWKHRA
jgi:hypothetical protein